jgi:ABC-type nitrate/sulfonate/bicarbonate transport system permease component
VLSEPLWFDALISLRRILIGFTAPVAVDILSGISTEKLEKRAKGNHAK